MARLILCCDGTWNSPDQSSGGLASPTNVVKIHNAIAERDAQGGTQSRYYHPGVGVDPGLAARLLGGAFGDGLDRNVKSAYHWLARSYRPGDEIFIFGFSRGAYTARFLAGMVCGYGLADLSEDELPEARGWEIVDRVYDADVARADPEVLKDLRFFNANYGESGALKTGISFLGVWDTVGALGIPSDFAFLRRFDPRRRAHRFQNTRLSPAVRCARHAVALDEQRQSFTPTLWTETEHHPDLRQLWFAGAHGDVGGGHLECGLSDGALMWMIGEASAAGLAFRPEQIAQLAPSARGPLHPSLTGFFAAMRSLPRNAPPIAEGGDVHVSVLERQKNPPIAQAPYRTSWLLQPGESRTVEIFAQPHWNETGIYLERGAEYGFEARGQWLDGKIKCGPNGPEPGQSKLAQWGCALASAAAEVERGLHRLIGGPPNDFGRFKRCPDAAWFALIGVIANGVGVDDALGDPRPHQNFVVGDGLARLRVDRPGYLYGFANDAWFGYGDNRGKLRLRVTRL